MSLNTVQLNEAAALAQISGTIARLDEERAELLATMKNARAAGEFGAVTEAMHGLADVRKLRNSMGMVLAAYHSGVRSALILACFVQIYLDLPEDARADARVDLAKIFTSFGSEATAASERKVADLKAAKAEAEGAERRARIEADKAAAYENLAMRQEAFNKSSALWRAFHTIYDITDKDVKAIFGAKKC